MESLKKHLLMTSGSRPLGAGESQSAFFVEEGESVFAAQVQSSYEGVVEYLDAWKKFDGAGTHLLDSLQSVTKDTRCERLGRETCGAFQTVYSSSNGIDPGGKLREMEKLMSGLKSRLDKGEKLEKSPTNSQVLCQCLLLFLKVHSDYHHMCSVTLTTLLNKLVQIYESTENKDMLQQMASLDLIPKVSRDSPLHSGAALPKKNTPTNGSPKLNKNNTFKTSLFSLFERKSSPDESKCAFYVDLNPTGASSQLDPFASSHVTPQSQSDILVPIGLDPVHEDAGEEENLVQLQDKDNARDDAQTKSAGQTVSVQCPGQAISSHPATEEDLDLVINLLSGIGGPSGHMEPIPENQTHLSVPTVFTSRTPSPRDIDDLRLSKMPTHRRSDGCLDFTGMGGQGRNTWPHRASLPTSSLSSQQHGFPDLSGSHTVPRRYSHDMCQRPSHGYTSPMGSGQNLSGGLQWGAFPESRYNNRTWPLNSGGLSGHCFSGHGSDNTLNSSWSAIQDSDDLSDDSSCGEQFFAVGLDLVHAIDSKSGCSDDESHKPGMKSPNHDRPHLSDDRPHLSDDRPHSAEDLLHEKQMVGLWPSSQNWNQPGQLLANEEASEGSYDQPINQSHRPVSMQWSDPLANRNVWPVSGIGNSHSLQGFGQHQ
ncbi:uncharacterized protein LOC110448189 isoform X2 [Mizuhopecten yessoensis]|uniref:uncharacterized protein LOC110448189 isoform X1 n=1 Tax=Mizuhopecten yessoensis TaxID=6573 RepID=UPI000B45D00E|nr:uncharacterized protein LOC110448189 isoform X1 [Mizuhopecten yessoensis]XP_021349984.1 uncharacterized protein LOC110448189 isoform X1 [Mizuhopecten yessoensis]XP_021349985.1 uncharacterized protein LOC110448189 isoform X2 [Mizuhopecten yessoensis]